MLFSAVGWRLVSFASGSIARSLKVSEKFEIFELRNKERVYFVKDFPVLSRQEQKVVELVFEDFLESRKAKKDSDLFGFVAGFCDKNFLEIDQSQLQYLVFVLESAVNGFGILNNFLENSFIEEIAIIGIGKSKPVFVYDKNFGWLKTNAFFLSEESVVNLANKMALKIGRHLSFSNPCINAFLPDGSRLNACIPPLSVEPTVTIRKFSDSPFTPLDLVKNKTVCVKAMAFLWLAMQTDVSVIIAGNTGSGKTTTLNALLGFVPKNERIILTEETPEIVIPHKHVARLKTVDNLEISMNDIITNTLRMRPDRVIVGEIRNKEETKAFINTLLAGQGKGSVATFHAKTVNDAILRLAKFGVEQLDAASIDLVIVQKRWDKIDLKNKSRKEVRKITEIAEICLQGNGLVVNSLFEFNFKKNELEEKNKSVKVLGKICNAFGLSEKAVFEELARKAGLLLSWQSNGFSMNDFFGLVNDEFD